jgi:hypothetical protein
MGLVRHGNRELSQITINIVPSARCNCTVKLFVLQAPTWFHSNQDLTGFVVNELGVVVATGRKVSKGISEGTFLATPASLAVLRLHVVKLIDKKRVLVLVLVVLQL